MNYNRSPSCASRVPANEARRNIYVHLSHGNDVENWSRLYDEGRVPDRTPYGFHLGADHGYSLNFSQSSSNRIAMMARLTLMRFLGFDAFHVFYNRKAISHADVIWTMLETEALAIAMLMWLRLIKKRPLLGSTVWIVDRWDQYSGFRKWLYRQLVPFFTKLFVHSERCFNKALNIFPHTPTKLMYFGVSSDTFFHGRYLDQVSEKINIFSAGNDKTRDWQTLLDAFGNDPRFTLTIACPWLDRSLLSVYDNLSLPDNITIEQFREFYIKATYVAIPMFDNIFSGITVALEATAMGIPLLATNTGGVPTYFSSDEVSFIAIGDAEQWRASALNQNATARQKMTDNAYRKFCSKDYTTAGMIKRYVNETESILTRRVDA